MVSTVLFKILSAKVESLTLQNTERLRLNIWSRWRMQLDHEWWNPLLLCIVVQLHTSSSTLTERSISSKMDKPWQTLRVYSLKTICIMFTWNFQWMFLPWFSVQNRWQIFHFTHTCYVMHLYLKWNPTHNVVQFLGAKYTRYCFLK